MLERVQERSLLHVFEGAVGSKLTGAEKTIAQWAIVDDYHTVLDLRCANTRLLRYLSQRYSLRACGIADEAADAHAMREDLPDAEILCARKEDIPWRDQSFDSVFFQMDKNEPCYDGTFFKEAMRVLKPGGQMLVTVSGMPELLCRAGDLIGVSDPTDRVKPRELLKSMEKAGFGDISYRLARPFVGLAMGWKWN